MLYSMLINIGSIIIILFILTTYIISLKKLNKIVLRQKIFLILIVLALLSISFDILEGVFYTTQTTILYFGSWKLHWLTTTALCVMLYYYFRNYLKIDNTEKWKDVYIDKKILTLKNLFLVFGIIAYLIIIVFVNPVEFNEPFTFIPKEVIVFMLVAFLGYLMFYIELIIKAKKNNRGKDIPLMIIILTSLTIAMALQIIIPTFGMLGLGFYLTIMFLYFLIENIDLIIAEDLVKLQKNIERSSNAKLDFLYNMSHDIRSPMNAIVELSKTLRRIDEFNEENIRNDISSIKFSCNNLVDIVNNILDINKIASGNESLQLKTYNLNTLLADMPYVIETRIGSRPIKLEFDVDQNIASKIIGDTTKLYRVIMNILTNSVKYTEVGKIKLTIKGKIEGDIQNLSIKISDTGYGIKKEDFDKMFTKFNRLDDATDNAIEGTGLGLVITKKYVDSMGGKIWFESEYGAGTTFFIELPQKIVDKTPLSQVVETKDNKKIEVCDCANCKVLIVDENLLNVKMTSKILEKYNIEVENVKNGQECIYKIKSGQEYDLILLDDALADFNGIDLVHIIKNIEGFKIPPVIAYTANVMNDIKEQYLKAGFDEYMPKPIDIYQFDSIIKKYCYKQKTGDN